MADNITDIIKKMMKNREKRARDKQREIYEANKKIKVIKSGTLSNASLKEEADTSNKKSSGKNKKEE